MRNCIFRKNGFEADYVSEYDPNTFAEDDSLIIVTFLTGSNFMEKIHIDDGDLVCLTLQKRNGMLQKITR